MGMMLGPQTLLADQKNRPVALRCEITSNVRPAAPLRRVSAQELQELDAQPSGPYRVNFFHGASLERLPMIGACGHLAGMPHALGGAGAGVVFGRAYMGLWSTSRTCDVIKGIFGSSKAPEGIVCEASPRWPRCTQAAMNVS